MMNVLAYSQMNPPHLPGVRPVALPRPQVGIERLPTRHLSNEPRESMNCKSCRKRKIKCNRLRPSCEACQVFQCPCIYDAVPKKRGPKTDVLEALLKRVDGLEAKLREKNEEETPSPTHSGMEEDVAEAQLQPVERGEPASKRIALDNQTSPDSGNTTACSPSTLSTRETDQTPPHMEAFLETYFTRFHGKPYYILDESSIRQRLQLNQLPSYLLYAISAVAARYTTRPNGQRGAVSLSNEYANRSRSDIDTDEPSLDALQALLLLVGAFTSSGKGKKAYMLLTSAVGMAMALEIHREMDTQARVTPIERELRRRLFWTCYLLDRFHATGSKRPCLISDDSIVLRLPCWSPNSTSLPLEGEFFQPGADSQYFRGTGPKSQGSASMLINITRILGDTRNYLAAGGVKGDSHFPWHSLSILSKVRQDLDLWASGTEGVFSSLDSLFGQADSTALVLSKLVYHLIHCLLYRPFLPIDLAELSGNGQHQSWQIEATNMCFLHANAIAELIQLGTQTRMVEWPSFVGYCVCTAGTVHVHGTYYSDQGGYGGTFFNSAAEFLAREMQQLDELENAWASVRHQSETLKGICNAHAELVKALATTSARYTPGFYNEDFFERYMNIGGPGGKSFSFDSANLSLTNISTEVMPESYSGQELYTPQPASGTNRSKAKRKATATSSRKLADAKLPAITDARSTSKGSAGKQSRRSYSYTAGMSSESPPVLLSTPTSLPVRSESRDQGHQREGGRVHMSGSPANNAVAGAGKTAGFGLPQTTHHIPNQGGHALTDRSFSPVYGYSGSNISNSGPAAISAAHGGYDNMLGGVPTPAFSSPAPWHSDENQQLQFRHLTPATTAISSGGGGSNDGMGNLQEVEKDPFLALLEQMAENEQHLHDDGQGPKLKGFLSGAAGPSS